MKKLKELHVAERVILVLTLACLLFTAGYFVGKSGNAGVITVERLAAATPSDPGGNTPLPSSPGPAVPSIPPVTSTAAPATPSPAAVEKININTASVTELDSLPGIGEVIAARIVSYRDTHGGFTVIDELLDVDGIGPQKFEALKDFVTVA